MLLSVVPVTHQHRTAHPSSYRVEQRFVPPLFPLEGAAPFLSTSPHLSHLVLARSPGQLVVCSLKGESEKWSIPSAPFSCYRGREDREEAALRLWAVWVY